MFYPRGCSYASVHLPAEIIATSFEIEPGLLLRDKALNLNDQTRFKQLGSSFTARREPIKSRLIPTTPYVQDIKPTT